LYGKDWVDSCTNNNTERVKQYYCPSQSVTYFK